MVQAEQSVIGCLMMAPELLDRARAVLSPAMFEAQPLARIFSCMLELKKAGTPVDAVTVVSRLGDGYEAVIRECACIAPRIGTFPQYAAIVLDAWRERTLVTELQSLAISGRTADEMTAELERMAAWQRSIMQKVHSASEQSMPRRTLSSSGTSARMPVRNSPSSSGNIRPAASQSVTAVAPASMAARTACTRKPRSLRHASSAMNSTSPQTSRHARMRSEMV